MPSRYELVDFLAGPPASPGAGFYVHAADARVWLRVHDPPHHGDAIDRVTLQQARDPEAVSQGVALGAFGGKHLLRLAPADLLHNAYKYSREATPARIHF